MRQIPPLAEGGRGRSHGLSLFCTCDSPLLGDIPSLQLRGSFLNFDGHGFERLVVEVLFGMLDGRPPRDVTGFVSYGLDLACRVGGPEVLIGEKDSYTIRRMRVHGSHSVWLDPDPQNPHLGVFEFQLVVAGIYLEWIEIPSDRLACP